MKKIILDNLLVFSIVCFTAGVFSNFFNPDMIDIQWIIKYWYIGLFPLAFSVVGLLIWCIKK
jgi:hypothetical protein